MKVGTVRVDPSLKVARESWVDALTLVHAVATRGKALDLQAELRAARPSRGGRGDA